MKNKKLLFIIGALVLIFGMQTFAQKEHKEERPQNLKILPKDIDEKELIMIMKHFSLALGVRCNHCHAMKGTPKPGERPQMDFASDAKPEKDLAREMMRMVNGINDKYLAKMQNDNKPLEQIGCITCHMGHMKPLGMRDTLESK